MDTPEVPQQMFRDGMARLGASVNVITSDGISGRLGFTATSVCSLSDRPPSLLVCMNRNSLQNGPLRANGVLCVNILAPEHKELSAAFAGVGKLDMESRFRLAEWIRLETGAPALESAVTSFDCQIRLAIDANTHTIMVCDVVGIRIGEASSSLIYFMREYRDLLPVSINQE